MDPVPDPLLLRKSGSVGNRTRDLSICSQKLWPLDHRGGLCSPIHLEFNTITMFAFLMAVSYWTLKILRHAILCQVSVVWNMTPCGCLERYHVSENPAASIFTPLLLYIRRSTLLWNVGTCLTNNTVSHPRGYTIHRHLHHNLKNDSSFYYLAPWLERLKWFRNRTWNTKEDSHWRRVRMNWQTVIWLY